MTNAEKEAREIVRAILTATGGESFPAFPIGAHAQRILRFAREYGPELAEGSPPSYCGCAVVMRDGKEIVVLPTPSWTRTRETCPCGDGTRPGHPMGYCGQGIAIAGPLREWSTPERGKPF